MKHTLQALVLSGRITIRFVEWYGGPFAPYEMSFGTEMYAIDVLLRLVLNVCFINLTKLLNAVQHSRET